MKLNKKTILKALDSIYDNALEGLPGTSSIEELAEDYTKKNASKEKAVNSLINWATAKNTTSGFVSSIGGIITLPIAIPVGLTASLYIQMRMVAGIATISGYNPRSDQVKTFIYCCLLGGGSVTKLMREANVLCPLWDIGEYPQQIFITAWQELESREAQTKLVMVRISIHFPTTWLFPL